MRKLNDNGSIVPLAVALLIFIVVGLLLGVFGILLNPISNKDDPINSFIMNFWIAIPVVVVLVIVFWAMAQGQRAR